MFENEGNIYMLDKNNGETNEFYYKKCMFISKIPVNNSNFDYYLKYATIYCNKKLLNIEYDNNINNNLKKIIEKFNINV